MRKLLLGALLVAGTLPLTLATGLSATGPKHTGEIHVIVTDRTGQAVDCQDWTGAIVLTPSHAQRRGLRLEPACCRAPEGEREGARESKVIPKGESPAARRCCGQIKDFEDWSVKLIVVRGEQVRKVGEGNSKHRDEPGVEIEEHPHAGPCMTADINDAMIKDPRTGAIHFTATLVFTLPTGETQFVRDFEYPEGVYEDTLGRLIEHEFKNASSMEHPQATTLALKIDGFLDGLPALWFKNESDRQEYEKIRQQCRTTCQRLEAATGKDIADAAGKCKSALKELRSQARDAEGALATR